MVIKTLEPLTDLYRADETAWLDAGARRAVEQGGRSLLQGRTGEEIQTLESDGQMIHRVMPELKIELEEVFRRGVPEEQFEKDKKELVEEGRKVAQDVQARRRA